MQHPAVPSPTFPLIPPHMLRDFCAGMKACATRNNIRAFPGAPHGFYIDEQTGELFDFFDGDDVEVARPKPQAARRGLRQAPRNAINAANAESTVIPYLYSMHIEFRMPDNLLLNAAYFIIGIDACVNRLWFYGERHRRITASWTGRRTEEWPPITILNGPPWDSHFTVPRGYEFLGSYNDECAPRAELGEEAIRYGDGSGVFIRHYSRETLTVVLNSWDWDTKKKRTLEFVLPHTIAYAANDRMVYLPYDGILGLGIMRPWAMLTYYSILQPSRFTVGLRHPAHANNSGMIADGTPLRDPFIIFGPEFPGQVTVEWTPRIYVWQQGPNPDTKWRLYMESMTLLVPKAGVDVKYDSEDGYEALAIQTNIPLVLDICSSLSLFPDDVVKQIKNTWLKNDRSNPARRPYCGPERKNLEACEITFSFVSGSERVKFRCNAAKFLATPWNFSGFNAHIAPMLPAQLRANYGEYKECPIASVSAAQATDTQPSTEYVLGMNFYWAAFVFHASDPLGNPTTNAPYVRLADQRALDQKKSTHSGEAESEAQYTQRLDE